MTTSAYIAGIGTAVPGGALEQSRMWDGFFSRHFDGDRLAQRLFHGAGVTRRHAALNPLIEDVSDWSTGRRMRRYLSEALPLGKEAVGSALGDAGLAPHEVGMFAVASCTGYAGPGLDIALAADLGMSADVQRLLVGHMGCYAAIPTLGAVADYVAVHGRPAIALCLELTSLHMQPATADRSQAVVHALFGDAAAAVVLTPAPPVSGGLEIVEIAARTDSASVDQMTWEVTDLGFRMGLSPEVPEVLARHVAGVVSELLAGKGLRVADVDAWAVHPGGPRILETVADRLDLPPGTLNASHHVLAENGNCSSPTVLLVLDSLRRAGRPRPGRAAVALAFGPGLTLYVALLTGT